MEFLDYSLYDLIVIRDVIYDYLMVEPKDKDAIRNLNLVNDLIREKEER